MYSLHHNKDVDNGNKVGQNLVDKKKYKFMLYIDSIRL